MEVGDNIWDSGSAITLMGESDFNRYASLGVARRCQRPKESSVKRIFGIGASNLVLFHATFQVSLGGAVVKFLDVPVLPNHRGLLFGNDVLYQFQMDLSYRKNIPGCDGFTVLHDENLQPISRRIPISVGAGGASDDSSAFLADAAPPPSAPSDSLGVTKESVSPLAYAPRNFHVPAWSEALLEAQLPKLGVAEQDVCIVPL